MFFYLRIGVIAAVLIATFVLHASRSAIVDVRIAGIALIGLLIAGSRLPGARRRALGRGRSPQIEDTARETSHGSSEHRT